MNRHLANILVVYAGHSPANLGKGLNQLQRPRRFGNETLSDTWVAVAIPSCGILELDFGGVDDVKWFQ